MANPIRTKLQSRAQVNREIEASVKRMADLYRKCRLEINDMFREKVMSSRDPFAGRNLIRLIESLSGAYGELEEAFRSEFEYAIPYVARNNAFFAQLDMGEQPIGKIDQSRINLMLQDSFAHIAGATGNMKKADVAFLRETSAAVFREASVTGKTRQEVSSELLGKFLSRPEKFTFTDAGGRVWDNKTYVDMLGRTVLHNAGREAYFDTCAEKGKDVVRVTVSGDSCPACAEWENRLLSISGNTPGLPTVEDAQAAGLLHPNCTHSFVAVGDSVRQRKYDEHGRPKDPKAVNSPEQQRLIKHAEHVKHRQEQLKAAREARLQRECALVGAKPIQGAHSREQDLAAANPNFATEKWEWRNNCQRCVAAYEARRRGLDVTAKPKPYENDPADEFWYKLTGAKTKMGYRRDISSPGKRVDFVKNQMKKWGDGARATVYVAWDKENAHVFCAEQINGKTVFYDPQSGQNVGEKYFFDQKVNTFGIARVDKVKFDNYIKEAVEAI